MEEQEENTSETMIQAANKAAERLELANKNTEELIKKQEEQVTRQILGGHSAAGKEAVKPKVDENAGAKELLKGTGYDKLLFPDEV